MPGERLSFQTPIARDRSMHLAPMLQAFLLRRRALHSRALSALALAASSRTSSISPGFRMGEMASLSISNARRASMSMSSSIVVRSTSSSTPTSSSSTPEEVDDGPAATARRRGSASSSSSDDDEGTTTAATRRRRSTSSSTSSSSSSTRFTPVKADQETRLYWQHLFSDLRRPSAARLARNLDLDFVLGLSGVNFSAPPLARFFASIKEQHPTKIALVRVGEFYEVIGADAVMLVEHAALNSMGTGPNVIPRAGCPAANLKRTLDDLVRGASLSVVVAEEAPEAYSYGTRARKKERYIAGVVTPAQPHYLVKSSETKRVRRGGNESSFASSSSSLDGDGGESENSTTTATATNSDNDDGDTLDATPPILGVSAVASASGFTAIEVDVEMRRFSVFRGLTEDAVSARLFSGGLSPPLYLHSPDDSANPRRFADASAEQEWSKRVSTLFRQEVGVVKRYGFGGGGGVAGTESSNSSSSLEPAVAHLLSAVRRDLGLPPNEKFAEVKKGAGVGGGAATTSSAGPQVYLCTASQLGIHRQRGVPNLLDALLPSSYSSSASSSSSSSTTVSRSVPLASRRWLERLLLMPPSPEVAREIRRALEVLSSPTLPAVPRWFALPAPHIVLKLRSGEASAGFFRDLVAMLDAVVSVASLTTNSTSSTTKAAAKTKRGEEPKHELRALAQALLSPTADETGTRLSQEELAGACERAVALVEATVADVRGSGGDEPFDSKLLERIPSRALRSALLDLFDANEGPYSGQVHASLLEEELAAVAAARDRVASAAAELVSKVSEKKVKSASSSSSSSRATASSLKEPEVVFDAVNNAVWVRLPRGSAGSVGASTSAAAAAGKEEAKIIHPLDRYGRRVADRWSSRELEGALDAYRRRCVAARSGVRGALKKLARDLAEGGGESVVECGDARNQTSPSSSSSSVSTMAGLVSAATFSTIGAALDAHAREAAAKGWGLPRLVGVEEKGEEGEISSSSSSSSRISISDFWPYWKERRDSQTNSIDLHSMALLTGPNMAGKSTVLRSVAACALLASCGLGAPARSASVPPLDAIVLRAFAADAPSSGRSSFAVEMDETRHVLAAASSSSRSSLILVDELGKGTEPAAGAAVAGAVLESLAEKRGCLGLFATHLHELLELPLERFSGGRGKKGGGGKGEEQQRFCMTTKLDPRTNAKVPAWKLAPGDSTESLAIEVAAEARVDPKVVARAAELYAKLLLMRAQKEEGGTEEVSPSSSSSSSEADVAGGGDSVLGAFVVDASIAPRAEQGAELSSSPSSSSVSFPPLFSLEDAAAVLSSAAAAVLMRRQGGSFSASSSSSSCSTFAPPPPAASLVRAGWSPPPAVVGRSCVYVVRRQDGYFYCGESDDLVSRLASHRSRPPVAGGNGLEACFVIVGESQGGKTAARAIESASIRSMVKVGLPLLSEADGVHRSGLVGQEGGGEAEAKRAA